MFELQYFSRIHRSKFFLNHLRTVHQHEKRQNLRYLTVLNVFNMQCCRRWTNRSTANYVPTCWTCDYSIPTNRGLHRFVAKYVITLRIKGTQLKLFALLSPDQKSPWHPPLSRSSTRLSCSVSIVTSTRNVCIQHNHFIKWKDLANRPTWIVWNSIYARMLKFISSLYIAVTDICTLYNAKKMKLDI